MNRLPISAVSMLALLLIGCPSEDGPQPLPPGDSPPTTDGDDASSGAETAADSALKRETDAWKTIKAQGTWSRLLHSKLKDEAKRATLEAALSDANADSMRRLALLVRYSPVEINDKVLNVGVVLRRHVEKTEYLGDWPLDDARTIALVLLPDASIMGRVKWLHYATGWTSVEEGVETGAFHLTTASDMRTAMAHAQHGRWEQAIPLYREVFVRLAKLNTDRQGSTSKQAWDAAASLLESGELAALQAALETWWRTFIPIKPKAN